MTTLSTKTYLQIVNDAIDESGSELSQFAADGSDWDTVTDAQMNRFKKWVKRAWTDIQQDANDWHWLEDTAVVTINPGIMVYTEGFNTAGIEDINVAAIVDEDGEIKIDNLYAFNYKQLPQPPVPVIPGEALSTFKRVAVFDLLYNDYTTNNQHALDFGIKSGAWRLTRGDGEKYKFRVVSNSTASLSRYPLLSVGDEVERVDLSIGNNPVSFTLPLVGGRIVALSLEDSFVIMDIESDSSTISLFDTLLTYAASITAGTAVNVEVVVDTGTGNKSIEGSIGIVTLSGRPTATISISPTTYSVSFTGNIFEMSAPYIGQENGILTSVVTDPFGQTASLLTHTQSILDFVTPSSSGSATDGFLVLNVTEDAGRTYNVSSTELPNNVCWSMWLLLMYTASATPSCVRSFVTGTADDFLNTRILANMYDVDTTTLLTTYTVDYDLPYLFKNYIHSWKSYDWIDELRASNLFYTIRTIDERSFRIIHHEDMESIVDSNLEFVPWSTFVNKLAFGSTKPSTPRYITKDNQGRWRLYPPLDRPYTFMFDVCRESQELEAWDDVPMGLPKEYEDIIMWLAVQYFGEYDEQPSVMARGRRNYKNIVVALQQIHRPKFHFVPHRLWR